MSLQDLSALGVECTKILQSHLEDPHVMSGFPFAYLPQHIGPFTEGDTPEVCKVRKTIDLLCRKKKARAKGIKASEILWYAGLFTHKKKDLLIAELSRWGEAGGKVYTADPENDPYEIISGFKGLLGANTVIFSHLNIGQSNPSKPVDTGWGKSVDLGWSKFRGNHSLGSGWRKGDKAFCGHDRRLGSWVWVGYIPDRGDVLSAPDSSVMEMSTGPVEVSFQALAQQRNVVEGVIQQQFRFHLNVEHGILLRF